MNGVTQLLMHKRSSTAIIGAVLLYLADNSGVIPEASELVIKCGTLLLISFVWSQTILDGIKLWKYGPNDDAPPA